MEKRAFDRNDIDHVKSDQGRVESARKVECVSLRIAGMFGGIDADQDLLYHRLPRVPRVKFAIPWGQGVAQEGRTEGELR